MLSNFTALALGLATLVPVPQEDESRQIEFFENKIRPVLVENCYECHNSQGSQEGGLALDYREALKKGGVSGRVIVPGKPDESLLIQALRHENGYAMPSGRPKLKAEQIADFERWVRLGAVDPRVEKPTAASLTDNTNWERTRSQRLEWWSFQPLVEHSVPDVEETEWQGNPIDAFVFARMQGRGLRPQPIASPETLVRRAHLILTGLPPSMDSVAEFAADPTNDRYERLVDRLLDTPAFGERWARHWMDWYRYAESHGSEGDPRIPYAQEYRNYLIRALNADVPYDRLLREHLAGDLLESPRVNSKLGINESTIGTAHLRMVPHGFGVTDAYGEQIAFTDNQIDVISKAMLGLTVSCARCHNHKFDPISQKDFYRLYGILVSSRPSTVLIDAPDVLALNKDAINSLKEEIRSSFAEFWLGETESLPARLDDHLASPDDETRHNQPLGAWLLLKDANKNEFQNQIDAFLSDHQQTKEQIARSIREAEFYLDLRDQKNVDNWHSSGNGTVSAVSPAGSFALQTQGETALRGVYPRGIYTHLISDKHAGVFSSNNLKVVGKGTWVKSAGSHSQLRAPVRNYPLIQGLHPADSVNNRQLQWNATQGKWTYWQGELVHYELSTSRDKLPQAGDQDRSWFGISEIYVGDHPPPQEGASLFALAADPLRITSRQSLAKAYQNVVREAVLAWRDGDMTDVQAEFLDEFVRQGLLSNRIEQLPSQLQQQIARYRALEAEIPVPRRAPGVLEAQPVDQPLLIRGDHQQESAPVERQFLEAFSNRAYDSTCPPRLQLAEDVINSSNQLTSRVLVNRLWAYTFGRGIVSSTDNFGRLGSTPTHPELLDHLAVEFQRNGWSIKQALRSMVTSRTFKSSSWADPATREADPENKYFSYYTARRLDAEAIHDSIKSLAGTGQRAVYKPVIRNELDSFLRTFNAPVPISTMSSRNHTNVPAQALTMLNGDLVTQAAMAWSSRIKNQAALSTPQQKVAAMFQQAYGRSATEGEMYAALEYLNAPPVPNTVLDDLNKKRERKEAALQQTHDKLAAVLAPVKDRLQRWVDHNNAERKAASGEELQRLNPIGSWDFEGDAIDSVGNLHGSLIGAAKIEGGALVLAGGCAITAPLSRPLREKSLEVVVLLENLEQRGGGAMTVQTLDGSVFDSVVFAEQAPGEWLAGSNFFQRTEAFEGTPEREASETAVHLVFVYSADGTIRAYRNGEPYGTPVRKGALHSFESENTQVTFGLRHGTEPTAGRMLAGRIYAARLYDRALSQEEVSAAADGNIAQVVTRKMVRAELSAQDRIECDRQEARIAELQASINELQQKIAVELERANRPSGGYFGLAHAILNSKEFIYVH